MFPPSTYDLLKFAHVLVAMLAAGASAASGLWMELGPRREAALVAVTWMQRRVVVPLFALAGLTGMLVVVAGSWPWTTRWVLLGIGLWAAALAWLAVDAFVLTRRLSWGTRLAGGAGGLLIVAVVFVMVTKP